MPIGPSHSEGAQSYPNTSGEKLETRCESMDACFLGSQLQCVLIPHLSPAVSLSAISPPFSTFIPHVKHCTHTAVTCARKDVKVITKDEESESKGLATQPSPPEEEEEEETVGDDDANTGNGSSNTVYSPSLQLLKERTGVRHLDNAGIIGANEKEVNKLLASRAINGRMFYLIEWKDGHEPSWLSASSIARDVLSEYESPWWKAARAVDEAKLRQLLEDEGRDVDAVDDNGRTALLFAAGVGSEPCVRLLAESGTDVDNQDPDGLTALHMATGYGRQNIVDALLDLGADPEIPDSQGRTPIRLAQELIEKMPKSNPLQFSQRLTLENILKRLEREVFECAEVEQILDRRYTPKCDVVYLVKWKDGSEDEWLPAVNIADDLINDYEAGLEYGIAQEVLDKRETIKGQVEYLVRWADTEKPTWEPLENVAAELIADFEKIAVTEVEKMQEEKMKGEEA